MQAESKPRTSASLYNCVLGDGWERLADPLRDMHTDAVRARGRLRIVHGPHAMVRGLAWMLRLPRPSAAADTRLTVTPRGDAEDWVRTFDGRCMRTRQRRSEASGIAERFGILEFRFLLQVSGAGGLSYIQHDAAIALGPVRLPMPRWCMPVVEATEEPAGPHRVKVVVAVRVPVAGNLITYDGFMTAQEEVTA